MKCSHTVLMLLSAWGSLLEYYCHLSFLHSTKLKYSNGKGQWDKKEHQMALTCGLSLNSVLFWYAVYSNQNRASKSSENGWDRGIICLVNSGLCHKLNLVTLLECITSVFAIGSPPEYQWGVPWTDARDSGKNHHSRLYWCCIKSSTVVSFNFYVFGGVLFVCLVSKEQGDATNSQRVCSG